MSTKEATKEYIDSLVLQKLQEKIFEEYSKRPYETTTVGLFTLWQSIEQLKKETCESLLEQGYTFK